MLNLGSLGLGLLAWIYGVLAITVKKPFRSHSHSVFSFSFCVLALGLQFLELQNRVMLRDFAAIEDTIRGILLAATALLIVTIVLNFAALLKHRGKELL